MQEDFQKCTRFIIRQLSQATMSASANAKGSQKPRFFDWLVNQIDSRAYDGLYWLDENCTTFRIPWKHKSRKNLVADDYRIFQEWARVGGKYEEGSCDLTRWKTNFRNALMSTKRFELLRDVKDPDPHHVYKIIPLSAAQEALPPINSNSVSDPADDLLQIKLHSERLPTRPWPAPLPQEVEVTLGALSLGNPGPVQNENTSENCYPCTSDTLRWVIEQTNLKLTEAQQISLDPALAEDTDNPFAAYVQDHCQTVPRVDQSICLPPANGVPNLPVENSYYEPMSIPNVNSQSSVTLALQCAQQNAIPGLDQFNNVGKAPCNDNCFIQNVFVDDEPQGNGMTMNNTARNDYQMTVNQQAITDQNLLVPLDVPCSAEQPTLNTGPLQNNTATVTSHLNISIYYRGKPLHETEVMVNSCMFTYNKLHDCGPTFGNPQLIQFPNPEELPDQKQMRHTLTLLQNAGLLLYEKNHKIYAKRLDKSRVYWAFSKQLDNMGQHSQFNGVQKLGPLITCLRRGTETEIFDYKQFWQELKDFHENRRKISPDYTIYLCFGQCISAAKPKESLLILVKLVPKKCKEWHEFVLREGASSLSSDMSLHISNSLMDCIEHESPDVRQLPGCSVPRLVP
ncbi:interferon regulatory factor 7 isoform X2 [Sphaerodactylus townsendi]|uniref:interferon regulatory factor 7 isoform X2 n=1 Tax=Sphaerodactylus townsendi TaxID=933632 RepID=UPI002026937F|nr:interferon regulatory factor 7 isoform X2 [Sphaerodactylus townsendi]